MVSPGDLPVPDIGQLTEMAAMNTEMFNAHVKAGMPPMAVAVMLGTWMATLGTHGQAGSDGESP